MQDFADLVAVDVTTGTRSDRAAGTVSFNMPVADDAYDLHIPLLLSA